MGFGVCCANGLCCLWNISKIWKSSRLSFSWSYKKILFLYYRSNFPNYSHIDSPLRMLRFGCVTWYGSERGKVRSIFPTLLPQGLTAKGVRMKVKSYQHSMTYNRLDREGNVGHCSSKTGGNRGRRRKGQMIGQALLRQNNTFSSEEILKRIFSFRRRVGVKRCADL